MTQGIILATDNPQRAAALQQEMQERAMRDAQRVQTQILRATLAAPMLGGRPWPPDKPSRGAEIRQALMMVDELLVQLGLAVPAS